VLGLPAICLVVFTVGLPRDIGLRYLLPVIALWMVAAGSIVPVVGPRVRAIGVAVVVVVAGLATALSVPDSLAWTTPPFTPAFQVVTNSDVDWGQSFYRLEHWSTGKRPWVAYFGPRGLGADSITGARRLLGTSPARVTGWVAVSATDLTSASADQLAWIRAYCPVAELGGSILVYRFAAPPSATGGPIRPAGLCPGNAPVFSDRTAGR
jgi:hypothetical protein